MRRGDHAAWVAAELTDRETEVYRLAVYGLTNEEIATRLAISRRTVEAHMRSLFRKLGVSRRTQLVAQHQQDDQVRDSPTSGAGYTGDGDTGQRIPQRRRDPLEHERQLRFYAAAIHGLVDRQFPLFEERVEITLIVGEQDGQDTVVERRWTTPRPYLVYRIIRPIIAVSDGQPTHQDDLVLTCHVDGQDTHVDVHQVWDTDGLPMTMILFQPGIQTDTEWVLRYRSPQLWDPLRRSGEDTLMWATATLDQRHQSTINELTLKVIFPASWTGIRVVEQNDFGLIHTERLPNGQHQVTWHQETPGAGAYHWVLQGSRGT